MDWAPLSRGSYASCIATWVCGCELCGQRIQSPRGQVRHSLALHCPHLCHGEAWSKASLELVQRLSK